MPEPPAPPPAPDLAAIEAEERAERLAQAKTAAINGWSLRVLDLLGPIVEDDGVALAALVAYARALEAANARLRAGLKEQRRAHHPTLCPKGLGIGGCLCGADWHNAKIDSWLTPP